LDCFDGDAEGSKSLARRLADGTTDGDENSAWLLRAPDGVVDRLMALCIPFIVADKTLENNRQNLKNSKHSGSSYEISLAKAILQLCQEVPGARIP
jgi:hypothetical protein